MVTDRIAAFAGVVVTVLGLIVGAVGFELWSRAGSDSSCHVPIVLARHRIGDRTIHSVQLVQEGPFATDEVRYELHLEGTDVQLEGSFAEALGADGNVTYRDRTPPIDRLDPEDRLIHEDPTRSSHLVIRDGTGRIVSGYGCP